MKRPGLPAWMAIPLIFVLSLSGCGEGKEGGSRFVAERYPNGSVIGWVSTDEVSRPENLIGIVTPGCHFLRAAYFTGRVCNNPEFN